MPTAFVTGGTGFVGLNLVKLLRERDFDVIAIHRASSKVEQLAAFGATLRVADVSDAAAVADAMPEAVDGVFHVAANVSLWKLGNREQTLANIGGTRNVVQAALRKKAKRFIHTSSTAAYGFHENVRITEDTASNAKDHWVNYLSTKWYAEEEVRKGMKEGLDAVILNPGNILGPYDFHNWSRMFRLIKERKLPGVPPGRGPFCHVEEVAGAHHAAFERGRSGQNYLLGGTDASYVEYTQIVAELVGRKAPPAVPALVLKTLGQINEWLSYVTRREPDVTPEKALLLSSDTTCDSSKAERELGYRAVPLRRMVEDTYRWLQAEGLS